MSALMIAVLWLAFSIVAAYLFGGAARFGRGESMD